MDIEQALQAVKDVFVTYPKRYEEVKEKIKQCELEMDDLKRVIEFSNLNASQGFHMYKELKTVQMKRRELKRELELLEVSKRINNMGKPSEKVLNQAIGDIRKVKKLQSERTYYLRVRKDLQELIK